MKKSKLKSSNISKCINACIMIFILTCTGCKFDSEIVNPYAEVDWEQHQFYKANLHTHTTRSDGSMNPQSVVDHYHQFGYHILAITDHNAMTYPWTDFALMKASIKSEELVKSGRLNIADISYENRNPDQLGILAIQACEISSPQHLGSYFTSISHRTQAIEETLDETAARDGLIIFNHPGKYGHNASWYCDYYKRYSHIIGTELYNQGDRYPNDRKLWDSILVSLMPERPVWGFSNDDMHIMMSLGHNWNSFILPELSSEWIRRGMEEGRFFYVYAPAGDQGPAIPQILSVKVNKGNTSVEIESLGQDSIRWISGGRVISRGNTFHLKRHPGIENYIRAEIFGPEGCIVGTQPFGIIRKQKSK